MLINNMILGTVVGIPGGMVALVGLPGIGHQEEKPA
jgi:uncharacterized membrane protein YccC